MAGGQDFRSDRRRVDFAYSEYLSARNCLWQEEQTSPTALTLVAIAASSFDFAADASSLLALLRFFASFANSSDFSQISGLALVLPTLLPLGNRLGILSAVPMMSLALVSIVA